jgi:uncharacterized membrane protein YqjE
MVSPLATSDARPGLQPPAPGVALALFTESVAHRAELARLELAEARDHTGGSTLLAVGAATLALCTGFAFTLWVASLVWDDPHRGWWLGGLWAAYLAATLATGFILARRLRTWRPFDETQRQLQLDYQCLHQLLKSNGT